MKNRRSSLPRRFLKGLMFFTILAISGVGALFAGLWVEHGTEVTLPQPTGLFPIGRTILDWTDDKTVDSLAPVANTKRELLVWIWYPAARSSFKTSDYIPAPLRSEVEHDRGVLLGKFLTRDLAKVRTHSFENAGVSTQQLSYPVVIIRAGASAEVWNYSTLAEELTSHGYIVVGFDAPYRTSVVVFPDGRVIRRLSANNPEFCLGQGSAEQERCVDRILTAWTSDSSFVLNRLEKLNLADPSGKFTGHLDMTRVGVFGHSLGGATALQFCQQDARCKAGIDVDGAPHGSVIQAGIHQPFMFLLSDHSRENDPESRQIMANIQAIYSRLPENARFRLVIRGANHFTFSDDGALLKSHLLRFVLGAFGKLKIDGDRQLAITSYCLRSFFDTDLKGKNGTPNFPSPQYPEIQPVP